MPNRVLAGLIVSSVAANSANAGPPNDPSNVSTNVFWAVAAVGIVLLLAGRRALWMRVRSLVMPFPTKRENAARWRAVESLTGLDTNVVLEGALAGSTDPSDQFMTGVKYENGYGVPKDYTEAAKWYRRAADQGNVTAQYMLGHMYEKGRGVPKDETEAVKWWRLAAERGYLHAQAGLGRMYQNGHGVPLDYVSAYMWLNLAAAQGPQTLDAAGRVTGDVEVSQARDKVAEKMTPAQIAEAQRMAREWKATQHPDP